MSAFVEKNGDTIAVSNMSMNARGDIVDARGNVKLPSQTISRANSALQSSKPKQVSLKADETLAPVQNDQVEADAGVKVVARRDVNTIDGPATEVEYSDGSIQVIPKQQQTPTSL